MAQRPQEKQAPASLAEPGLPGAQESQARSLFPTMFARIWVPLLLAAVTFLVYVPSLRSDFVYDARVEILEEGFVTSLSNLPDILSLKVLSTHLMLGDRPGQLLYLMLIAAVSGSKPFGYHLCSNLLHAANVALLYGLLCRLLRAENRGLDRSGARKAHLAAGVVTLIFALHPIVVEPVSAISYSSDLLVTFCILVALLAATALRPESRDLSLLMGGACVLLSLAAVMCKESGLATAALLMVYWFLYRRGETRRPWLLTLGLATGLTALFLAARFVFAAPAPVHLDYLGGSFFQVFLNQPRLWVFMFGQLIWPTHLSADYTLANVEVVTKSMALAILALVLLLQVCLMSRSRLGALGVAIFWLGLVTVSNFLPLYRILADRFYYLPLAGLAMQLLALLLLALNSRVGFWALLLPLLVALVPLTALNLKRQEVFANEYSLWKDTLAVSPLSSLAHVGLGSALAKKGEDDEAIVQYRLALQIDPSDYKAHNNLGNSLFRKNQGTEAIAEFQKSLRLNPDFSNAHYDLANALAQKGSIEEAVQEYREALKRDPRMAQARAHLGDILYRTGQVDEAAEQYKKSLAIDPNQAPTQTNMGNICFQKGDVDEAMDYYQAALKIDPGQIGALIGLGSVLGQQGRLDEAIVQFKLAVQSAPGLAVAHANCGQALLQAGRVDEAIDEFRKTVALTPQAPDAHNRLGAALMQKNLVAEAIAEFQEALRLNPGYADARNNLTQAQASEGQPNSHP